MHTWFKPLSPCSALIYSISAGVAAILLEPNQSVMIFLAALLGFVTLQTRHIGPAKSFAVFFLPMAVPLFVLHGFLNPAYPWETIGFVNWPIRVSGAIFAGKIASQMVFVLLIALPWFYVGKDRIVEFLFQLKLPVVVIMFVAQAFSLTYQVKFRTEKVVAAQQARGLPARGSLKNRLTSLPSVIIPIVVSVLSEAEFRAVALGSRGIGLLSPHARSKLSVGRKELSTFAFALASVGAAVTCK